MVVVVVVVSVVVEELEDWADDVVVVVVNSWQHQPEPAQSCPMRSTQICMKSQNFSSSLHLTGDLSEQSQ